MVLKVITLCWGLGIGQVGVSVVIRVVALQLFVNLGGREQKMGSTPCGSTMLYWQSGTSTLMCVQGNVLAKTSTLIWVQGDVLAKTSTLV